MIDRLIDHQTWSVMKKSWEHYSRYIWICETGHSYFFSIHREQDARITALQSEKEYVPFVLFCFEILINNQILSSMQLTEHNDALEKNALRRKNRQFRNRIVLCWNVLNPIMFPNFCRPKHFYIFLCAFFSLSIVSVSTMNFSGPTAPSYNSCHVIKSCSSDLVRFDWTIFCRNT